MVISLRFSDSVMGAVEDLRETSPVRRRSTESLRVEPMVAEAGGMGCGHVKKGRGDLVRSWIEGARPPPGKEAETLDIE
jgi:hypothetical protein